MFRRRSSLAFLLFFSSVFLALIGGCTEKEVRTDDPESVFESAEEAFKDERYFQALERYRDVKNRFPYHSRATDAELRIADTYFAQEAYLEAASSYEIFKELHPTHPKSDYVSYQVGLSYFNQIPDNSARDLSAAYRAIEIFENFIEKYPKSEYSAKAKENIEICRGKLAEHENYVADFYYRRRHYLSATYRYNSLLKDFPDSAFQEEALYRLGRSYLSIKQFSNARDTLNRLLSQYPQSAYRADAQSMLEEIKKR